MTDFLIGHLWQSSIFAGFAWVLTTVLHRNGAHVRHWIWFAASLKFLIPFALLVHVGSLIEWRPAVPEYQRSWIATAEQISQPVLRLQEPAAPFPVAHIGSGNGYIAAAFVLFWFAGFLLLAALWLTRLARVRTLRRSATPFTIGACPIPVLSTAEPIEPGVFGFRKPVLLVPNGVFARLTEPQLRAIIAHELCHIRRRDNLTAAIHMGVQAVFWFHPLVWWIGSRLLEERERACDEAVLLIGEKPRDYAEGILTVCRLYAESPVPCVAGVGGSDLRKRIEKIMANRMALGLSAGKRVALAAAATAAFAVPVAIGVLDATAVHAQKQTDADAPKFEVASIRPCESGGAQNRGGRGAVPSVVSLRLPCSTVMQLIRSAYDTSADGRQTHMIPVLPITGGPAWINTDRYTINAGAEGTPSQPMMWGPMLRQLLEDRFQLRVRRETRELPIYLLVVAPGGSKVKSSVDGKCPTPTPVEGSCPGSIWFARKGSNITLDQQDTLSGFSRMLTQRLGRPVIDKTEMKGIYDFHIEFAPDEFSARVAAGADAATPPAAAASDAGGPSIFTALQQQLGLKLVSARGPSDVLVVEHVERPSEN